MDDLDAARYYSALTAQYERYAVGTHGWHYGIWEPDVTTHRQALLRSNELLLRGLEIGPSAHILDVGFGVGGFSVWAARRTGARVTGISLSADHVLLANDLAKSAGVTDRCRFEVMNMDALRFDDSSVDLVVNQETCCHAADKRGYLAAVHRVLRPGGWWRAVDFSRREEPFQPAEEVRYRQVREGFHIASLVSIAATSRLLQDAGFEEIEARDVTPMALRTASRIIRNCYLTGMVYRLGVDRVFRPVAPHTRAHRVRHVTAGVEYSRGLQSGLFRHAYYSARKPPARR